MKPDVRNNDVGLFAISARWTEPDCGASASRLLPRVDGSELARNIQKTDHFSWPSSNVTQPYISIHVLVLGAGHNSKFRKFLKPLYPNYDAHLGMKLLIFEGNSSLSDDGLPRVSFLRFVGPAAEAFLRV